MKRFTFLALLLIAITTVAAAPASAYVGSAYVTDKQYSDVTLGGTYTRVWEPGCWDLTRGPVALRYEQNLSGAPNIACTNNWNQMGIVGLMHRGSPWVSDGFLNGARLCGFLYDYDNPAGPLQFPSFPDKDWTLDNDDKFNLQRWPNPGNYGEGMYDYRVAADVIDATPFGSGNNYGIWFDRDGVDQWQDDMWGMVDGGTYRTYGIYDVGITVARHSATKAAAWATMYPALANPWADGGYGIPTGFYVGGWTPTGPSVRPAGLSFDADDSSMTFMEVVVEGSADGGTIGIDSLRVTGWLVESDAPAVTAASASPNPVQVDVATTLTATIDDTKDELTGGSSIHHAEYRVDGGPWQSMTAVDGLFDEDAEDVTALLPGLSTPDVCVIEIRGWDAAGNVSPTESLYVVVYDPSGGFVTGGGWIDSPAGASSQYPDAVGKASFGFVSKYLKGATVPTGSTEFQFKAGDLNFHSDSYDWLVVNRLGMRAQYKGVGTLNGEGAYKFMIWANDGTSLGDFDSFRISIWSEDEFGTETVVYDNGTEQAIAGGSIVVHVPTARR